MLFPTATFAIFFLIVLPLSWLAMPKVHRWRPFILIASYVFYSWWDWRFIFLLAGCTIWNQVLAVRIHRASTQAQRKALLIVALAGDLGVLAYFKYYDFFISSSQNMASIVGLELPAAGSAPTGFSGCVGGGSAAGGAGGARGWTGAIGSDWVSSVGTIG